MTAMGRGSGGRQTVGSSGFQKVKRGKKDGMVLLTQSTTRHAVKVFSSSFFEDYRKGRIAIRFGAVVLGAMPRRCRMGPMTDRCSLEAYGLCTACRPALTLTLNYVVEEVLSFVDKRRE